MTFSLFLLRKNAPAPWAVMEGELNRFVMESSKVRALEDPSSSVQYWENVIKLMHNMVGEKYGAVMHQTGIEDKMMIGPAYA